LAAKDEAVRHRQNQQPLHEIHAVNPASAFTSLNHQQQLSADMFSINYILCHKAFSLRPILPFHLSFKVVKKRKQVMSTAGLARGARMNRELLNNMLKSHNLARLMGANVDLQQNKEVNTLLHTLGLDPNARFCAMLPCSSSGPFDVAGYLIISYEWNYVLHAREVEEALPKKQIPAGFESAIQQIAKHGVWCVTGVGEHGLMRNEFAESVLKKCPFSILSSQHIVAGLCALRSSTFLAPIA
jgi:hypothetical protein